MGITKAEHNKKTKRNEEINKMQKQWGRGAGAGAGGHKQKKGGKKLGKK